MPKYNIEKLEQLVRGAEFRSEVITRIKTAIREDEYFKKISGVSIKSIFGALVVNKLLKGIKMDAPRDKSSVCPDIVLEFVIDACIESWKYNPRRRESQGKLKELKQKTIKQLEKELQRTVSSNLFHKMYRSVNEKDTERFGEKYENIKLPLSWGFIPDRKAAKKKQQKTREALKQKVRFIDSGDFEEIRRIISRVEIPAFSVKEPWILDTKKDPQITVINTPELGLAAGDEGNLIGSQVKNTLIDAQARKCDAVIVTGNLGYLDTKRFSNLSPLRAQMSGIKTDPNFVNDKDATKKLEKGEPIFLSFKEKFDILLGAIGNVFVDERKNPFFDGPILICFGLTEEGLAIWYATEKMNQIVAIEKAKKEAEISDLKVQLKNETDKYATKFLNEEIAKAMQQKKLIKATALNNEFKNECREEMVKYIILRLEELVPNAKVISVGEGGLFLNSENKMNCKLIEALHRPDQSITDTYFKQLLDDKYQAIAGGEIPQPDMCLVGGLNLDPKHQTIDYAVAPIVEKDFSESMKRTTQTLDLFQLPTCIDGDSINRLKQKSIRFGDPLIKFAKNKGFCSGAFVFQWVDGILAIEPLSQDYLSNNSNFLDIKRLKEKYVEDEASMFYGEEEGDNHIGHQFVARYEIDEFPYELYHHQLVHKILLENKVPICFYANVGDTINAQNYRTWEEIHPEDKVRSTKFLKFIDRLKKQKISAEEKLKILEKEIIKGFKVRGILNEEDQLAEYFRTAVESDFDSENVVGLEYFANILKRAKRIGLRSFGSLGIITFITGNHSLHSQGNFTEATQIVTHLKIALRRCGFSEEELDKMVKAPSHGTYPIAEGLLGVGPEIKSETEVFRLLQEGNNPYFYCVIIQHKPAAGRGIYTGKDKGRSIKLHQSRKGTTQAYQQGRFTVRLAGDIHVSVTAMSKNTLDVISGSQTFFDPWRAYLGLSLNSINTTFIGHPVGGPSKGSFRCILLRYNELMKYVKNPWPINFKKLFRNALGWD